MASRPNLAWKLTADSTDYLLFSVALGDGMNVFQESTSKNRADANSVGSLGGVMVHAAEENQVTSFSDRLFLRR